MATARKDYGDNEHSILYAETSGCCPLCSKPILFRKPNSGRLSKGYEVTHIYPLNPTLSQATALVGRAPPTNINALENVIALCPSCHTTERVNDFAAPDVMNLLCRAESLSGWRALTVVG